MQYIQLGDELFPATSADYTTIEPPMTLVSFDLTQGRTAYLSALVQEVGKELKAFPENVMAVNTQDLLSAFLSSYEITVGLDDPAEILQAFNEVSAETFGDVLFQLIGGAFDKKRFNALALAAATSLGPDHAQTLYRLAVLITKLA